MTRRTTASTYLTLGVHAFAVGTLAANPSTTTTIFAFLTLALLAAQTALTLLRYRIAATVAETLAKLTPAELTRMQFVGIMNEVFKGWEQRLKENN